MKKILFATFGLLVLTSFATVSANETQSGCNNTGAVCQLRQQFQLEITTAKRTSKGETQLGKDQISANKAMIQANKNNFNANFLGAKKYLIKPLTGEQRIAVNAIIKVKQEAMKILQRSTNALIKSGVVDRSGYITQATNIITTFKDSLLPYVAVDQLNAFDTFIQSRVILMINNITIRQTNSNIKMQIGTKKTTFKERLQQKRLEFMNTFRTMMENK